MTDAKYKWPEAWSEWRPKFMAKCPYCGGKIPTISECGRCGDLKALDVKYIQWSRIPYGRQRRRIGN